MKNRLFSTFCIVELSLSTR